MSTLRKAIVRLAYEQPELRPHLLPLLKDTAVTAGDDEKTAREWGNAIHRQIYDDKPTIGPPTGTKGNPSGAYGTYKERKKSPPAGEDGSAQRKKYNEWYRKNVCPSEDGCGAPWLKKKKD